MVVFWDLPMSGMYGSCMYDLLCLAVSKSIKYSQFHIAVAMY